MMLATVGHGSTALWYLTRATGLVSLILLSATLVLGIVSSLGWTTERWPRFLSQAVHRNLSLFCLCLIAIHVVTTIADGYVPIGYLDAIVPFRTPYRPLWVGMGALAFDLLLTVAITSGLRRRIGVRAWRGVHWLAYLCWPIAVLHGLGAGSDTRLSIALLIEVGCVAAVAAAGGWRLIAGHARSPGWRLAAGGAGAAVVVGIAGVAVLGPLQPGWSHRAGTAPALLAQLSGASSGVTTSNKVPGPTTSPTTVPAVSGNSAALPTTPFSRSVTGTYRTTPTSSSGLVEVIIDMKVDGTTGTPLVVELWGTAVNGGVAMSSSQVTWGAESGTVTSLQSSTVGATVHGPSGTVDLVMELVLNPSAGSVSGTVAGTSTSGGST